MSSGEICFETAAIPKAAVKNREPISKLVGGVSHCVAFLAGSAAASSAGANTVPFWADLPVNSSSISVPYKPTGFVEVVSARAGDLFNQIDLVSSDPAEPRDDFDEARPINGGMVALIADLYNIEDGWNGPDSRAPSEEVKSDLCTLALYVDLDVREPDVEVDEDGSVSLRWENSEYSFALTLNGNERVIGTIFPRLDAFPIDFALEDQFQIISFLNRQEVRSVLL